MSKGSLADRTNTKAVLNGSMPKVSAGKTWLGHSEYNQSGMIDLLIIEGIYSFEEIVVKVKKAFPAVKNAEYRVQDHIQHLQTGDARGRAADTKPHNLKITTAATKIIRFDVT